MSATDRSMREATPRPWRVNDLATNSPDLFEQHPHYHVIEAGDGFYDHDTGTGFRLTGYMSDADAALIVGRSDAVDALVEAARISCNAHTPAHAPAHIHALRAALAAYDKEPDR